MKTKNDLLQYLQNHDWPSEKFQEHMIKCVINYDKMVYGHWTGAAEQKRRNTLYMDLELIRRLLGCGMAPTAVAGALKTQLAEMKVFVERESRVSFAEFCEQSKGTIQKTIILEILKRLEKYDDNDALLMKAAQRLLGWVDKEPNSVNVNVLPANLAELKQAMLNDPFMRDVNSECKDIVKPDLQSVIESSNICVDTLDGKSSQ